MSAPDRWPDLDPDERAFVDEFAAPLAALAGRMQTCPPLDQLLAAHAAILSEPLQAEVSSHLRACPICQGSVRDALAWELDAPDTAGLARVRERLPAGSRGGSTWSRPVLLALAASLAALVALGAWAVSLRQQNEALRADVSTAALLRRSLDDERARRQGLESQVARLESTSGVGTNVVLLDLEPVDALRGTAPRAVQVPARTTLVTLVLATTGPPAASYELEIRDARDHVTWQGGNLTPGPAGALTLVLPKGLLPLGDVRLRLYAIGPEGRRLAHEYAVRIGEVP